MKDLNETKDGRKDVRIDTEKEILGIVELLILMFSGCGYICFLMFSLLESHGNFLWLFQSLSGACLGVAAVAICMNNVPSYESEKVIKKLKKYVVLTVMYFWICYMIGSIVSGDILWFLSVVPAGCIFLLKTYMI